MQKSIHSSKISGSVTAPASKSYVQRAIACSLLAEGESWIYNVTPSEDFEASIRAAEALGAEVEITGTTVRVDGKSFPKSNEINCGEAGLTLRMFAPIAALYHREIILTGSGSLLKRPFSMAEEPLRKLGAEVKSNNGRLPVTIKGPIRGGVVTVDGSTSSQFLTGLLIALPHAENDSVVNVTDLKSRPYIDMTLECLEHFGITVINHSYEEFVIKGRQSYQPGEFSVEGDWSGASFLLVAGAIAGKVRVKNLKIKSMQGDRAILDAITSAGAMVMIDRNEVAVHKNRLKPFEFDATDCPDLFPPLVALAANCEGTSYIRGAERLLHKESNRALVLKNEYAKVGIDIEVDHDLMKVHGGPINSGEIDSCGDHRIAMSLAVAGLCSSEKIKINNAEAVNKSYPNFFEDFRKIGAVVEKQQ